MGHTKDTHSLPFGHSAKAAVDIDGLVVSHHVPDIYVSAECMATSSSKTTWNLSP